MVFTPGYFEWNGENFVLIFYTIIASFDSFFYYSIQNLFFKSIIHNTFALFIVYYFNNTVFIGRYY